MSKYGAYFDYVFSGDKFPEHSGVHSPAITLDPQYQMPYNRRLPALRSIASFADSSQMARRVCEWYALPSNDPTLRQIARRALKLQPEYIGKDGL